MEKQLEESVTGMAHLIGRLVHVPRAVFAADIKGGFHGTFCHTYDSWG